MRRFLRNNEVCISLRHINTTGKSVKNLSTHPRKNILLCLSGKSSL
jgi:hypothetical protein